MSAVFEYFREKTFLSGYRIFFYHMVGASSDTEETAAGCSKQDVAVSQLDNRRDTCLRFRWDGVSDETVGAVVVSAESHAGTYPQIPLPVCEQCGYVIATDRIPVLFSKKVVGEVVAVKLVQPIFRAHPDETIFVLAQTTCLAARQFV